MLSASELEKLVDDVESDRVERKESLADPERILQAICAFANDLPDHREPGCVIVGVTDAGRPNQLPITERLLLTLASMRSDGNILPFPVLAVAKMEFKGDSVAVVQVQPSDSPPVRLRGQVWIRVGPRRAVATAEEERRLTERQIAGARTFDRRNCRGATLDDILIDEFREQYLPHVVSRVVILGNERSIEQQLASLRLFDLRTDAPTHGGIIILGRDPRNFIPGAYLQFVRFEGESLVDPVQDEKEIAGNLLTQLAQLDNLLPLQIRTARVPGAGLQHEERPDYPLIAVRELTLNAIMHRTYEATNAPVRLNWFSNRVEILSPGGLYGQVTKENFGVISDYRNPVIAEAMKSLGYVERFGTGIARAHAALHANGNPPAEFTIEPAHVLAVLRSSR